ncbi:MAG: type II toxin-antitoxin system RelE/ParE family toxin [Chloroflexi bacterium]|nr:type II toxin-antitoxin system RelE/ParE family toxin [Chloroflexota bacterium]
MMVSQSEWTTEFYKTASGDRPVEGFLLGLDTKTRARFRWSIEQLRVRNIQARAPLVKHLDGPLWELREESSTNIYRIIYFVFTGRRIVFVHGFQKKTQKTPDREITVAMQRYRDFIYREERRER